MYITKVHYVDVETGEYLARDDILKKRYIIKSKFENYEKMRNSSNILKNHKIFFKLLFVFMFRV